MDADTKIRRKEVLASFCDQRARILREQLSVSVNHVHALVILVSTLDYYRNPSAIDQETFAEHTAGTAFERPLLSGGSLCTDSGSLCKLSKSGYGVAMAESRGGFGAYSHTATAFSWLSSWRLMAAPFHHGFVVVMAEMAEKLGHLTNSSH